MIRNDGLGLQEGIREEVKMIQKLLRSGASERLNREKKT